MNASAVIPILGDQLSHEISGLRAACRECDCVLMVEAHAEAHYAPYHKQKLTFTFSAMRHFAEELEALGWNVRYLKLDDPGNSGDLYLEIERVIQAVSAERVILTEPGNWRLRETLVGHFKRSGISYELLEDDRFLCSHGEFEAWTQDRKQLRMEHFYRRMRRKSGLLMRGDAPIGGKWNFDAENRKTLANGDGLPSPIFFAPGPLTKDVMSLVRHSFAERFGTLETFNFAVTANQAAAALDNFIENALPHFGDYQDAMLRDSRYVYHSVLSQYINVGLLDPLAVCRRVEAAYHDGHAPLNAVEGFIRQIIGWREFVRGIYWHFMPGYLDMNYFNHKRKLPEFYWTADTEMLCLRSSIEQTRDSAYAHHIQRLMLTGNFAMLAGVDPHKVHEWYLAVYADAFEWVEAPNTLGMSQFADGGLMSSKPYAASGNYIKRMSNYCDGCRYSVARGRVRMPVRLTISIGIF
ncbi:MAG: cryptochrome/photolyase family protein [Candidatus Latescibacterota bacterium]